MTRAVILTALALLSGTQPALCSTKDSSSSSSRDSCLDPGAEIAGLHWDLKENDQALEGMRKQLKTYELTEGSQASISRVKKKIRDHEQKKTQLTDELEKKQGAYEATCK